ncbi:MAG: hypothetical protein GY797_21415 [Deltaproteobacteria bacterium]|nr:hypothetical protein [Deltaproteobacteria bacterium]
MYIEKWERCYAPAVKYAARPDEPKLFSVNKLKAFLKKILQLLGLKTEG